MVVMVGALDTKGQEFAFAKDVTERGIRGQVQDFKKLKVA